VPVQAHATEEFIRRLEESGPLPAPVEHAAKRMLFNVIGTAVGAIGGGEVEPLFTLAETFGGRPVIAIPGDARVLDRSYAALVIGSAAHAEDFDDTHLLSIVHPAASAFAATYAAADDGAAGVDLLRAFAVSCELQIRLALCLDTDVREHHPASFTALFGTLGAGLACAMLRGLDPASCAGAVGYALASSIGSRQSLGTFAKPLHTGRAAASGLAAAVLAAAVPPPADADDPIAGRTGVLNAHFDGRVSLAPLFDGLGERWEIVDVAFKPYPCGVLLHPIIDAALATRDRIGDPSRVKAVEVACNAAVARDTAIVDPKDSLQAKFSASHAVAAAIVDGTLGRRQYAVDRVRAPEIAALRPRIRFRVETSIPKPSAVLRVEFTDGTTFCEEVKNARGSLAQPLTDDELMHKVAQLFEDRLPGRAPAAWNVVKSLDRMPVAELEKALTA
jgi:2-methylcitrate dehydratase PrpD